MHNIIIVIILKTIVIIIHNNMKNTVVLCSNFKQCNFKSQNGFTEILLQRGMAAVKADSKQSIFSTAAIVTNVLPQN